ncbi:MAG TPA: hypothetical protein VNI77_12485 [Nitrososphaera sp.]|nr:hypothetical protein [Nitrososphaera sp.]
MGQTEVFEAIKALGGQATYSQIREYLCRRGYCENSIRTPLRRLKYNGSVRVKSSGKLPLYVIPPAAAETENDQTATMTTASTATMAMRSPPLWPSSR